MTATEHERTYIPAKGKLNLERHVSFLYNTKLMHLPLDTYVIPDGFILRK